MSGATSAPSPRSKIEMLERASSQEMSLAYQPFAVACLGRVTRVALRLDKPWITALHPPSQRGP